MKTKKISFTLLAIIFIFSSSFGQEQGIYLPTDNSPFGFNNSGCIRFLSLPDLDSQNYEFINTKEYLVSIGIRTSTKDANNIIPDPNGGYVAFRASGVVVNIFDDILNKCEDKTVILTAGHVINALLSMGATLNTIVFVRNFKSPYSSGDFHPFRLGEESFPLVDLPEHSQLYQHSLVNNSWLHNRITDPPPVEGYGDIMDFSAFIFNQPTSPNHKIGTLDFNDHIEDTSSFALSIFNSFEVKRLIPSLHLGHYFTSRHISRGLGLDINKEEHTFFINYWDGNPGKNGASGSPVFVHKDDNVDNPLSIIGILIGGLNSGGTNQENTYLTSEGQKYCENPTMFMNILFIKLVIEQWLIAKGLGSNITNSVTASSTNQSAYTTSTNEAAPSSFFDTYKASNSTDLASGNNDIFYFNGSTIPIETNKYYYLFANEIHLGDSQFQFNNGANGQENNSKVYFIASNGSVVYSKENTSYFNNDNDFNFDYLNDN